MKALLLKDIYTIKKYIKTLFIILFLLIVLSISFKNSGYIAGYTVMSSFMVIIATFSYDEYSKWDNYALTLPFTKKKIVTAKYILSLIFILFSSILSIGIISGIENVQNTFNFIEVLQVTAGISLATIILFSLILPIIFKFGTQKSRLIIMGIILVTVLLCTGLGSIIPNIFANISGNVIQSLIYLSPIICILVFYISYLISCKIYMNKDI